MPWKLADLYRTKDVDLIVAEAAAGHGDGHVSLNRTLGVWDLTFMGIAAVIGAGIFSTVGNASANGGPAVVFLFLLTSIACCFSALAYAEFASAIPTAGSAYTYAYASFGEIFAWIIGWDLLCEYAIGNIAVAISWSEYASTLCANVGIKIPSYLTQDYMSAWRGFGQVSESLATGRTLEQISASGVPASVLKGYDAWLNAPRLAGLPIICNLPALLIVVLVTFVAYRGIKESKIINNVMVLLKLAVIGLVILLGSFYISPRNWVPFAPNGISGVFKGVSAVFFAYIGFDAVSTTAEECKNPQRDLPRGMIYSLVICTVLYMAVSLVLTGMVPSAKLAVGDPLAFVFGPEGANIPWVSALISVSAVVALTTVMLVFQIGQPRIWMAMSRDGLLPPIFSSVHPKFRTPWFATIVAGFVVATPSLFMNLSEVTDLTSIGTLFAFVLVSAGVLRLNHSDRSAKGFRVPYINSQFIFPAMLLLAAVLAWKFNPVAVEELFGHTPAGAEKMELVQRIPLIAYCLGMIMLAVQCLRHRLSLIPVMGIATCGYLMTELGVTNWIRFGAWLLAGVIVYLVYGHRHSKLGSKARAE
jgi:APA family basic amino acid/polyamine antiporter